MGYISKYNTSFVTFVSRKYKKFGVMFYDFDDYILWLYDYLGSEELYYKRLESDLREYCIFQGGGKNSK